MPTEPGPKSDYDKWLNELETAKSGDSIELLAKAVESLAKMLDDDCDCGSYAEDVRLIAVAMREWREHNYWATYDSRPDLE